ncbi:uncharacterized protein LOC118747120 [Rhagoletis pomonella]|uniref:uncharacterized protein LOC118747120 n=1 Tax=Rhagoletis pomonella TaxID=28610 RepID=UPI00177E859A|nr:uncharacterized protein LOC118747120 [Rhagoletis pomonella]
MIVNVRNTKYTEEERSLAQNIKYMSSKAYGFMREDLSFRLPHQRSLLRWRPIRYVRPGIDESVIANLKNMVTSMPENHRICQITWDEISIRKDLTYNQFTDVIDGFVDNGQGQREMVIGNKCLFFMIKGICSKWKYILSYYVSHHAVCAKDLAQLIRTNIEVAQSIGLKIKAAVCDQAGPNQSAFRILGVSEENGQFLFKGEKIHFMYDYCHLMKSMRNTFLNNHEVITEDGIVRNLVVKKLYAIDKANDNFKICPKLTDVHVYPNSFEKMSVSRATQLLSNSVAAGIEMANDPGLLGEDRGLLKSVKPTQIFVKRMNDLFDELDVKYIGHKNPLKWPMRRNSEGKTGRLLDHIQYLQNIGVRKKNLACIKGFILTIRSVISLCEDILDQYPSLDFVLCGKLNQDALENFFYKIRASQGLNMHPTAHDIQYIVARLMSMKILRHRFQEKRSNCEDDDDVFLDWIDDHSNAEENGWDEDLSVDYPDEQLAVGEDPLIGNPDDQLAMEEDLQDIPEELFIDEIPEKPAELQVQRY